VVSEIKVGKAVASSRRMDSSGWTPLPSFAGAQQRSLKLLPVGAKDFVFTKRPPPGTSIEAERYPNAGLPTFLIHSP